MLIARSARWVDLPPSPPEAASFFPGLRDVYAQVRICRISGPRPASSDEQVGKIRPVDRTMHEHCVVRLAANGLTPHLLTSGKVMERHPGL